MVNVRGWKMLAATTLFAGCSAAQAAQTISVHDGDTFTLNGQRWRLWGVDAPELDQVCSFAGQLEHCGRSARDALEALVRRESVECTKVGTSYDRAVGQCWAGDQNTDLSAAMVREGWALNWDRYSHGAYAAEEADARVHRRGIWSTEFTAPWDWRAAHRR